VACTVSNLEWLEGYRIDLIGIGYMKKPVSLGCRLSSLLYVSDGWPTSQAIAIVVDLQSTCPGVKAKRGQQDVWHVRPSSPLDLSYLQSVYQATPGLYNVVALPQTVTLHTSLINLVFIMGRHRHRPSSSWSVIVIVRGR
jgi:hypothetical protein